MERRDGEGSTLPHPPHKAHHADAWRGGSQGASTQREREREREGESQGGGGGGVGGGGGKAVVRASPVAALTYSSNSRVYAQLVQEAYVCSSQVHESESERAREIEIEREGARERGGEFPRLPRPERPQTPRRPVEPAGLG